MQILEIDMGNTATKWRVRKDDHILQRGKLLTTHFPDSAIFFSQDIGRIRFASVCPEDVTRTAIDTLSSGCGLTVERAVSVAAQAGVVNSYADPSRMGVDRWLAMLAGFNTAKNACLVVSCGTATTIDFIGPDGIHGGGYILPGLMMMRTALLSNTGRIRYDAVELEMKRDPGTSTMAAVEHGAVHALASAVETAGRVMLDRWNGGVVFMTGGDGNALSEHLYMPSPEKFVIKPVEELVLDGLRFALP